MDNTDTPTDYGEPLPPYFQDKNTREIISVINDNPSDALSKAMIEGQKIRDEQEELKKEGFLRDLKNFQKGKDVLEISKMKENTFNDYKKRKFNRDTAKLNLESRGVTVKGGKYRKRKNKRKTSRKSKKRRSKRRH